MRVIVTSEYVARADLHNMPPFVVFIFAGIAGVAGLWMLLAPNSVIRMRYRKVYGDPYYRTPTTFGRVVARIGGVFCLAICVGSVFIVGSGRHGVANDSSPPVLDRSSEQRSVEYRSASARTVPVTGPTHGSIFAS